MTSPSWDLKQKLYDANALGAAAAIMDWDQQTYMPSGGSNARAAHLGILGRMRHEIIISREMADLISKAEDTAETPEEHGLARLARREHDLATKLPSQLVEEKLQLSSAAQEVWIKARKENDFASFSPVLARLFEITREEAHLLGFEDHIYDALIDQYEEGATKKDCDILFDGIREPLVKLVKEIGESPIKPDDSFLHGVWDEAAQRGFTEKIVRKIGFDFSRGRQDTAHHPFCTNFSVGDVRLTTRFLSYLPSAIFGSLHEAGHGMYEQGSPMEWDRTPLAGGASLGIHESQSRTWENLVGRSKAFWEKAYPDLQSAFPPRGGVDLDTFYAAVNRVEPSLIRVEADEVTYNLHIMIRYELECALLSGELAVPDLPEAWNSKYQSYLGITPPSDSDGCLQDIHWSAALIGYFPTYSMGNVLSGQFWTAMHQDLGSLEERIRSEDFAAILGWLQNKIYSKGSLLPPRELVRQVTGKGLDPRDYLGLIESKYRAIYGI
jgi:carboxypeptidase Taq